MAAFRVAPRPARAVGRSNNFVDVGTVDFTTAFPGIPTLFQNLSSQLTANIVRVGLNNLLYYQLPLGFVDTLGSGFRCGALGDVWSRLRRFALQNKEAFSPSVFHKIR